MKLARRKLLKAVVAIVAIGALFRSRVSPAAEWPKEAFNAMQVDDVLRNLYGTAKPERSNQIRLQIVSATNNGARVPIAVSTTLKQVESISIIVDKNPQPLAAHVDVRRALPYFATDLKFATSSTVTCIVKAAGKLYTASRGVRVTVGATAR
jgi:sulfur-oxidizing protein SoxY